MNKEILVSLEMLHDNPFQPRQAMNQAEVEELAANIEHNATEDFDGLLQVPTVRAIEGGHYQLGFGHRRLAAVRFLFNAGKSRYGRMRVMVRELTDLQMFEYANSEGIHVPLNPIERAAAMQTYMDKFQKTSEQAGEFFHVSAETVRGMVRLLGLLEPIQVKVREGALSIGTARKLLSVQAVSPEAAISAAQEILDEGEDIDPETIDFALDRAIERDKNVIEMWLDGRKGEARGGKSLWPLTWQHKGKIAPLTEALVYSALEIKKKDLRRSDMTANLQKVNELMTLLAAGMYVDPAQFTSFPKEAVERIAHLANPPKCVDCPFYSQLNSSHFCGVKGCWERKAEAWVAQDLQKLSKQLGISVYDPAVDGETFVLFRGSYGEQLGKFKKMIEKKDQDLRLIVRHQQYEYPTTDHAWIAVIDVSKQAEKSEKAKSQNAKKEEELREKQRKQMEAESHKAQQAIAWVHEIAVPVFAKAFDGLTNVEVMLALFSDWDRRKLRKEIKSLSKTKAQAYLRARLTIEVLFDHDIIERSFAGNNSPLRKGTAATAKFLQGVAAAWGVKLPKDWLTKAKEWESEQTEEVVEE